jgi:hypothetical protein
MATHNVPIPRASFGTTLVKLCSVSSSTTLEYAAEPKPTPTTLSIHLKTTNTNLKLGLSATSIWAWPYHSTGPIKPYLFPCPATLTKCYNDSDRSFYFPATAHLAHLESTSPHPSARNPRPYSSTNPKNSPRPSSPNYKLLLAPFSTTPALSTPLYSRSPTNSHPSKPMQHDESSTQPIAH